MWIGPAAVTVTTTHGIVLSNAGSCTALHPADAACANALEPFELTPSVWQRARSFSSTLSCGSDLDAKGEITAAVFARSACSCQASS